ncbi:MAG: hypothetical protein ABFS45_23215 [Pseudomonadota bacterium]
MCLPKIGALGDIDIEICRACDGAVRIIVCIEDPVVIEKILAHLKEKATPKVAGPATRGPPVGVQRTGRQGAGKWEDFPSGGEIQDDFVAIVRANGWSSPVNWT